jgi:outer membrane protein OmpA-like peptidoglycan-associated protein
MSNAFMIVSFLLLLALLQSLQYKRLTSTEKDTIVKELIILREENNKLKEENNKLKAVVEKENKQNASPIVIDEKSGNFKFQSGSAELNSDFQKYLNNSIIPQIKTIIKERNIDFIQVIGHTDGQVLGLTGNLDRNLEKVAQNQLKVNQLNAGSNADLALMRALAVVQQLQSNPDLKNVKFRAYSGAQLYLPSGELAPLNRQADETRRRIEIRFIPPAQNN